MVGLGAGFDSNVADGRGFESFGGVVNEIDNDAAKQARVGANGRRTFGERSSKGDSVEAVGEHFDSFADDVIDVGGFEFGGREADKLREFVDQRGKRADFAFDEAGRFLDQAAEFGIDGRGGVAGFSVFFEIAGEALRGELDRSKGIFDFVGDAASDFLPGGGFLGAEKFGEVVKNQHETGIGAAWPERADGDRGMHYPAAGDDFEFTGDHAGTQSAAEEITNGASVFGADQLFKGAGIFGGGAE